MPRILKLIQAANLPAARYLLVAIPDAFEGGQTCRRDGTIWRCGDAATRRLAELVGSATIECEQRDIDRYERIVARCTNGRVDLAAELAHSGLALAYRQYSADYIDEEAEAQAARRGAWAGTFDAPWDWRRRAREPGFQPADHSRETLADCVASLRHERATASLSLSSASLQVASQTTGCAIKGNISKHGERTYHVPGSEWYDATRIDPHKGERWFCSEDEARSAGWRAPR